MQIPTVRVKSGKSFIIINECDRADQELYVEPIEETREVEVVEVLPVVEVVVEEPLPSLVAQKTGDPVIPNFRNRR